MNLAVDLIGEAAVWCCCRHAASVLHKFRSVEIQLASHLSHPSMQLAMKSYKQGIDAVWT